MAELTFQSGLRQHDTDISKYALFLGGLNVTHDALEQYDPLRTGYGRIFMVRKPIFLTHKGGCPDLLKKFKHIIEYGNTGVSGNGDITMAFNAMQGGYTNRQMEIPNIATDDTNELTIKVYEFAGSPVRELIQMWINGVSDIQSGFAHYNGIDLPVKQSNHTAEFIYVVTDPSGKQVEFAALYANCFPKSIKLDQFNYESGEHGLVQLDLTFTATRYMSPQINLKAKQLIERYRVLVNSLNFNSGVRDSTINGMGNPTGYDPRDGKLKTHSQSDGYSFGNSYVPANLSDYDTVNDKDGSAGYTSRAFQVDNGKPGDGWKDTSSSFMYSDFDRSK